MVEKFQLTVTANVSPSVGWEICRRLNVVNPKSRSWVDQRAALIARANLLMDLLEAYDKTGALP